MQLRAQDEEEKRQLEPSLFSPYYRYRNQAWPGRCKLPCTWKVETSSPGTAESLCRRATGLHGGPVNRKAFDSGYRVHLQQSSSLVNPASHRAKIGRPSLRGHSMLGRDPCPAEVRRPASRVAIPPSGSQVPNFRSGLEPDAANACQVQKGTNHRFAANNQDKLSYSGGRNRILDTAVQRHLRQAGCRCVKRILIRNA
jgi:hypothetical protein